MILTTIKSSFEGLMSDHFSQIQLKLMGITIFKLTANFFLCMVTLQI